MGKNSLAAAQQIVTSLNAGEPTYRQLLRIADAPVRFAGADVGGYYRQRWTIRRPAGYVSVVFHRKRGVFLATTKPAGRVVVTVDAEGRHVIRKTIRGGQLAPHAIDDVLAASERVGRCRECRTFYVVRDRRQRFCSERCGARVHQRRHRRRRRPVSPEAQEAFLAHEAAKAARAARAADGRVVGDYKRETWNERAQDDALQRLRDDRVGRRSKTY